MIKKHGKAALKGKEVDHKDMRPAADNANRRGNLQILTLKANRKKQPKRK